MTSAALLETFVSLTVQVSLLVGVAAWFVRKQEFRDSSDACWAMLHVCILALTCGAFFLPHIRVITWADLQPAESSLLVDQTISMAGRICAWIWATGAVAIIAVCVGGIIRGVRLVRCATIDPLMGRSLCEAWPALSSAPQRIEIRMLSGGISPFCWQMHRPVILLPEILRDFPAAEQSAIIQHELAHLRRQHPLHLFLQRLVEAVYWYHPLVWWASRQAAAAREFRCDRDVVASDVEVADYLRSLLRLIESRVKSPSRLPAGIGFLGDRSLLSRRANILASSLERAREPRSGWRAVLSLMMAAVVCAVVWLPINPDASRRSDWSPWPGWTAGALNVTGVVVRDYEIDGHRLRPNIHRHE
ncbi:MAG TPA: M56 family metallopeptidase [Lacipirellulaceae bacterium]|nr:M56 family metallopeptidase [Lacipirellulaceae bacterium]